MTCVTIRLEKKLIETLEKQAHALQLSKTAYIHKAIEQLKASLMQASLDCRAESQRIYHEFSQI